MINLDDLTAPVLTDVQRQIIDYTESRPVTFDFDTMRAEAAAAAGAEDIDDAGGFTTRLCAQIAAIEADTGLRQLIRYSLRNRLIRLMRNRFSLTDLVRRYPQNAEIEIAPGVVIHVVKAAIGKVVEVEQAPSEPAPPAEPPAPSA